MKNKGYRLLIVILILICTFLGYKSFNRTEYVHQVYAVSQTPVSWYKIIAKSVNSTEIKLNVDGIKTGTGNSGIIMNDLMELMMPIDSISKAFDCAVYQYNNNNVTLEKASKKIEFTVGNGIVSVNDENIQTASSSQVIDGKIYVPITSIAKTLAYDYRWNVNDNVVSLIDTNEENSIPYKYDYREKGRNTNIFNQGKYGTCWAFASLTALQTSLLPLENLEFSVEHMVMNNSSGTNMYSGGDYSMSIAYLTAWQGPVLTKDDKYGDGKSDSSLKAVKHVQEIQIVEAKDYEKIKEAVYKYGGVQSSLYMDMTGIYSYSKYYNKKNSSYCYVGTQKPNHDVVIIGWDDSYSKENFKDQPDSDGAFICQNSWGENFGDNGIFYVSYYDSNIAMHNIVYTGIEDTNNYDNIYQSDLCGMVGYMGYGRDNAYFANVYTAKSNEEVEAVSFYATGKNTSYSIFFVNDFENVDDLTNKRKLITSGKFENAGYYTVKLTEDIKINKGENYAIIVNITTPNSTKPVAVEYKNNSNTGEIILDDGNGYISWSGKNWEDTEKMHNCNICLKAFTNDIS